MVVISNPMMAHHRKTDFKSCHMCAGVFFKCNAKLTCWCNDGYNYELGDMRTDHVGEFITGNVMQHIRNSFQMGYEPFKICQNCIAKTNTVRTLEDGILIQVEPSNICNLFCEFCSCTFERQYENPPKRKLLPFELYSKSMEEIRDSNIKVAVIGFIGYGEPLFNPYICQMSQLARNLFPESLIFIDTNANHSPRKARNLADCGVDEVRMGIDGVDQVSYVKYREQGNFDKCIKFAKALCDETKRIGSSTKPIWKYILFNHNDSDDQIDKAMQMADEMGVKILFHLTSTPNKSLRKDEDIISQVGMSRIGSNVDKKHRSEDH